MTLQENFKPLLELDLGYRTAFKPEDKTILVSEEGIHIYFDIDFSGNVYNNRTGEKVEPVTVDDVEIVEIPMRRNRDQESSEILGIIVKEAVKNSFRLAYSIMKRNNMTFEEVDKTHNDVMRKIDLDAPEKLVGVTDGVYEDLGLSIPDKK